MKYPNHVVYRVAELFLNAPSGKLSTQQIADKVNLEAAPEPRLTRESIYPILGEARRRRYIRLVPPLEKALTDQIIQKFKCEPGSVRVVDTTGPRENQSVATSAAEMAVELVQQIGSRDKAVGLGLGPGRATLDFCHQFVNLITADPFAPKLKLMAISAGCPAETPEYASISFFNLFPPNLVEKKVGLFAETLVPMGDFEQIKTRAGVQEAFRAREEIDIVVTSMGDVRDEHDLLNMFMAQSDVDIAKLPDKGWVGNVQYRPYTAQAPVKEKPSELRAVTLFELEDLVHMSKLKGKHVLLIARQCGICGRNRAEALRPLLQVPELRVFSNLVLDAATARDLVAH